MHNKGVQARRRMYHLRGPQAALARTSPAMVAARQHHPSRASVKRKQVATILLHPLHLLSHILVLKLSKVSSCINSLKVKTATAGGIRTANNTTVAPTIIIT